MHVAIQYRQLLQVPRFETASLTYDHTAARDSRCIVLHVAHAPNKLRRTTRVCRLQEVQERHRGLLRGVVRFGRLIHTDIQYESRME